MRRLTFLVAIEVVAVAMLLAASATVSFAEIPKGDIIIRLETVASGLTAPVSVTHAGDGSGRLFVVEQSGQIRIAQDGELLPTPFLDLSGEIPALNPFFDERGLLGLAFHPHYQANGRFFVRYSKPRAGAPSEPCFGTSRGCHEEVLAEFSVSDDPNVANLSGTILFRVDEPQFNHDAGEVAFGPDGFLYFTLGDGGGAHDGLADAPPSHGPIGNGQNIATALGAILRIDVDSPPQVPLAYAIPPDNPFVGEPGVDEIRRRRPEPDRRGRHHRQRRQLRVGDQGGIQLLRSVQSPRPAGHLRRYGSLGRAPARPDRRLQPRRRWNHRHRGLRLSGFAVSQPRRQVRLREFQ
jgi:hypothetical protein